MTGYQTLLSVASINPAVYNTSDRLTVEKHWSSCFIQNSVSEDIYDAIASKSGSSSLVRDQASTIPMNV